MILYISICFLFAILILVGNLNEEVAFVKSFRNNESVSKDVKKYRSLSLFLTIVSLTLLWVLTAFRGPSIGADTYSYISVFKSIAIFGINSNSQLEIGYLFLCKIISMVTSDPHIFLIIISTILYAGTCIYVIKYSYNPLVSACLVFCFCFSIFTNILRQDLAMLIVLFAFQQIKKGNNCKAALLILFATLFHRTAYIAFALFFAKFLPCRNTKATIAIAIVAAALASSGVLNSFLMASSGNYVNYFTSARAETGSTATVIAMVRATFAYLLIRKSLPFDNRENQLSLAVCWLLLITSCFGFSTNIFNRISNYFLILLISEFPNALFSGELKNKELWSVLYCIASLALFLAILILRPEWNSLCPYEFWRVF